jgi:hypothetical protein
MDAEAVQVGIAPTHGDLNGVVQIGDGLIAAAAGPAASSLGNSRLAN